MRALLETQKHAAAELESLVLARTQQLQTANEELLKQMTERAASRSPFVRRRESKPSGN